MPKANSSQKRNFFGAAQHRVGFRVFPVESRERDNKERCHEVERIAKMLRKSRETARRQRSKRSLRLETLHERALMAADAGFVQQPINTTPAEQMAIELINRARANPSQEADRLGIALNSNLPTNSISSAAKAPLAPNESLLEASRAHSADMLARNFFSHQNPDNQSANDRAVAAGYSLGAGENIAFEYKTVIDQDSVESAHEAFFGSAPHRQNFLNEVYDDVGIGFALSPANNLFGSPMYTTEVFGLGDSSTALTGVVFDDAIIDDDFYSMGEGWSEISIEATDAMGRTYSTLTNEAGGYTLILPNGKYDVVANHPTGLVTKAKAVEIAGQNVKLDFTSDQFTAPTPSSDNKKDVNGDGILSALDALQVINRINRAQPYDAKYDVNGDGLITPIDVLVIVNAVNSSNETGNAATGGDTTPAGDLSVNIDSGVESNSSLLVSQNQRSAEEQVTEEQVAEELDAEVNQVKSTVGSWLKVSADEIQVESARFVTFENTELGAGDRLAGQALTEGYQIIVRYRTAMYDFRGTLGSPPTFIRYSSINDHTEEGEDYCCPWETLGQHCLDAIDAAIEDFAYGIVAEQPLME